MDLNSKPITNLPQPSMILDADKIPDLDQYSLDFLSQIVKNDLRYLEFDENLAILSLSGDEVGTFSINVKPFVYKRNDCFEVIIKSFSSSDDGLFKIEINALVDQQLNTIEQEYYEYLTLPTGKLESRISLRFDDQNDEFILEKKVNENEETKKYEVKIKRCLMSGYISESSNILLQRLMIQSNRFDEITLFTFDSNLSPAKVFYRPLDTRLIRIDDDELEIKGLERTVESYSDVPTTWQIYFSSDGHMINRVQIGYPAVIRALRKPPKIEIDEYLPKITVPKKDLNWEEDMQLKSKYQDRKEEFKNDYDQYLKEHPELKSLMADFMQSVLIVKPSDVVSYAARYFAPYSSQTKSNELLPTYSKHVNIPKH